MPPDAAFHRGLLIFTAVLAFCVVAIGAWVRLNAAGLGCPDWPACYGHLSAGGAAGDAARIDALYPSQPVIPAKAALEMLHRYLAGTLGLVVAASAFFVWWRGRRTMAAILVLLVVFQALLGMWTVTRRLAPLAVTGHLLGGMSLLALLWWLALDAGAAASRWPRHRLFPWAAAGLALLFAQIALGAWTSSHHAGLACLGFPACDGSWLPDLSFGPVAIQWSHRLGALTLLIVLGGLALMSKGASRAALAVGLLLLLQIALGAANVLSGLTPEISVAHTAGAALLLLALVTLVHRLNGASP
ncbi:COX15/CtaA family protein [Rhodoblastus sp.]|uniref:COX15/CtaA family protein n=1 Tax=Rhodoblastus sp. TaxID=1962975 RepID=UPI003F9B5D54